MKKAIFIAVKTLVFCAVLILFGFLVSRKIDLITADLGRHIQNGRIIISGAWPEKLAVLNTNFYSYTMPDGRFINHHWGSGVIFFLIYQLGGFVGVSGFYVLLSLAGFALYYALAIKRGGWLLATALAVLFAPLMASRAEVRPEVFTYLFSGIFFWMLSRYTNKIAVGVNTRAGYGKLFLLPVLMIAWVNLHIGFIFGIFILGAFWFSAFLSSRPIRQLAERAGIQNSRFRISAKGGFRNDQLRCLTIILITSVIAGLINPFGIRGLFYPLNIFRQYGYMIVENQSIRFLENLGVTSTLNFGLYKIALAIAGVSVIISVLFWYLKQGDKPGRFWTAENIIMVALGFLGYFGIRHFPSFAFIALPTVAGNLAAFRYYAQSPRVAKTAFDIRQAIFYPLVVFVLLVGVWRGYGQIQMYKPVSGFGLLPGVEKSADFYNQNKISGPIFNNYDIGGYLIYGLSHTDGQRLKQRINADTQVFVDNRPEAYSVDFFEKIYKPMQESQEAWQKADKQYEFNAIFFSHRDFTPWGQKFLISRVIDPAWAVVYYDSYAIIMLKRNEKNQATIEKYEIPKEKFGVASSK